MMGGGLVNKIKTKARAKSHPMRIHQFKEHVATLPVARLSQSVSLLFCLNQTLQTQVNFFGKCHRAWEETQLLSPNQHGLLRSPPLLGK